MVLAHLCLCGTQVLFRLLTYEANMATTNWTLMPEPADNTNAASAIMIFMALASLVWANVEVD